MSHVHYSFAPLVGPSLLDFLAEARRACTEVEVAYIIAQVLLAVWHLHAVVHVAHRDIKLGNVIIEAIHGCVTKPDQVQHTRDSSALPVQGMPALPAMPSASSPVPLADMATASQLAQPPLLTGATPDDASVWPQLWLHVKLSDYGLACRIQPPSSTVPQSDSSPASSTSAHTPLRCYSGRQPNSSARLPAGGVPAPRGNSPTMPPPIEDMDTCPLKWMDKVYAHVGGALHYLAPEVAAAQAAHGWQRPTPSSAASPTWGTKSGTLWRTAPTVDRAASDVWAVGVLTYALLQRSLPFNGQQPSNGVDSSDGSYSLVDNDSSLPASSSLTDFVRAQDAAIRHAIQAAEFTVPIHELPVSDAAKQFLGNLLQPVLSMRPTPAQALASPWLQQQLAIMPRPARERLQRAWPLTAMTMPAWLQDDS